MLSDAIAIICHLLILPHQWKCPIFFSSGATKRNRERKSEWEWKDAIQPSVWEMVKRKCCENREKNNNDKNITTLDYLHFYNETFSWNKIRSQQCLLQPEYNKQVCVATSVLQASQKTRGPNLQHVRSYRDGLSNVVKEFSPIGFCKIFQARASALRRIEQKKEIQVSCRKTKRAKLMTLNQTSTTLRSEHYNLSQSQRCIQVIRVCYM